MTKYQMTKDIRKSKPAKETILILAFARFLTIRLTHTGIRHSSFGFLSSLGISSFVIPSSGIRHSSFVIPSSLGISSFVIPLAAFLIASTSCSGRPGRIPMPKIIPAVAARDALDTFDANQNGLLEPDEIKDAPELTSAFRALDTDGDGAVSAVELEQRLRMWIDSKQALHILPCQITYRGQPFEGATVRFIPAKFLGEAFKPAAAVTDHYGVANMMHAPEDRPDPDFAQGVRVGFYRVEVSKLVNNKEVIPKKYNVNSVLGLEVSHVATGMLQGMVEFHLK